MLAQQCICGWRSKWQLSLPLWYPHAWEAERRVLQHLQQCSLNVTNQTYFSHPSFFLLTLCPRTPLPIKLKRTLHIRGRLLIANSHYSKHLQWCSLCDPERKKYFSHPSFFLLLTCFLSNPITHKTETGIANTSETPNTNSPYEHNLQWCSICVTLAAHLEQSNYLPNQKQGTLHKYDLKCFFITLFQGSSRGSERCAFFPRSGAVFQWICWIWLLHLVQDFQCWPHIPSAGGDVGSGDRNEK
jgi:hypothetical protein